MKRNKTACNCKNVTYGMIEDAIKNGAKSYEEIQEKLRFGTGCGKCREFISFLVRDYLEEYAQAEKTYSFWGWEKADAKVIDSSYKEIENPRDLYDALSQIWCADTCAPRMRSQWTKENQTLGQCSITAFLAQDLFGGKVYGVPLEDGNFHCYNVVGDCQFDLTSEQFGDRKLNYENNPEQFREVHFAKEEKRKRYEYLKKQLGKIAQN